jgi:hypothetical protein
MNSTNLAIIKKTKSKSNNPTYIDESLISTGAKGVFTNQSFRQGNVVCYFAGLKSLTKDLSEGKTNYHMQCNEKIGIFIPDISHEKIKLLNYKSKRTHGWMVNEPPSYVSDIKASRVTLKMAQLVGKNHTYMYNTVYKKDIPKIKKLQVYPNVIIYSEDCERVAKTKDIGQWMYVPIRSLRPILEGEELFMCYGSKYNRDYETTCSKYPANYNYHGAEYQDEKKKKKEMRKRKREVIDLNGGGRRKLRNPKRDNLPPKRNNTGTGKRRVRKGDGATKKRKKKTGIEKTGKNKTKKRKTNKR